MPRRWGLANPQRRATGERVVDIDLNCDLGEGAGFDAELIPLITSANVACGAHAGDAVTAAATLRLAARHGVQVGAHPGFFDRAHFGRRELARSEQEVFDDVVYQVGALTALARSVGATIRYIKPHGALYNMANRDATYARPLVAVGELFGLPLLGLPGSVLEQLSTGRCGFVPEGFADRRYRADGSLVPRSEPGAIIDHPEEAVRQAIWLLGRGVRTICVHGDNPQAVTFVRELRSALTHHGVAIRPFTAPGG
ncbi:MAG: LamB/YcsF family protein [Gemmataceae bacterium]|nr:LamB/YcsF family protein [Gemmataceae bacterium]MDW8266585.1 5-oxoprolinase subunit PxpA [Gemmataceae bacterium]